MTLEFEKNILIKGKISCLTGLHVGGVAETMEIGGTDNPVILDRLKNIPIIPGSSLKGKIRALIELRDYSKYGNDGKVHSCEDPGCPLCLIFGRGASEEVGAGPTRLIVRDAFPTEETEKKWNKNEDLVHGTEIKGENWINRITSAATPRFIERVPAGSEFNFEMIYSVYQKEDLDRLKLLFEGMCLLEDNYLGGSGSRGYGKIRFKEIQVMVKTAEDYKSGDGWQLKELGIKTYGADETEEGIDKLDKDVDGSKKEVSEPEQIVNKWNEIKQILGGEQNGDHDRTP